MARERKRKTNGTTTTSTNKSDEVTTQANVPNPFKPVPPKYRPLVQALDKSRIHILHVDTTPIDLKRRVFMVPVWMNVVFTAVLLVRLYYAIPFYFQFLITYFGHERDPWIDANKLPWSEFLSLVITRVIVVLFDVFLSTKVLSWPVAFCFAAPASPVNWRTAIGFQEKEVVSRKSRSFHNDLKASWTAEDLLSVKIFATEALNKMTVSKTGYTLIAERRWELDFATMIQAQQLVNSASLVISDFDRVVFAFTSGAWHFWQLEGNTETPINKEEGLTWRLKTLLEEKGKGPVFYRYIELIQYETSSTGAGTNAWRERLIRQLDEMFGNAGLELKAIVSEMGGIDKMPGLETASTS
ncbi:MAG: hypothetical protein Q9227_003559 [Pyrenula ochraceoflavens]